MNIGIFKPADAEYDELRHIWDADAVVVDPGGWVRICRSGKPDEEIDTSVHGVIVTP
jgi:hypothetical protein